MTEKKTEKRDLAEFDRISMRGIGRLFVSSMSGRDYPALMGVLMMGSCMVVFFNLIADIIYGWLDPRIQYE